MRVSILSTLLVMLTGCTSNWVTGVSTSGDGKHVSVVGGKLRNSGFGWYIAGPRHWECTRDAGGRLSCKEIVLKLPVP